MEIPVIPSRGTFLYSFDHLLMCNFKLLSWEDKGGHDSSFRVGMDHSTCSWGGGGGKNTVTCSAKSKSPFLKSVYMLHVHIFTYGYRLVVFFLAWNNELAVGKERRKGGRKEKY